MKTSLLFLSILLSLNLYSKVGHCESDDAQKSFELEEENVEIRDTEGDRIAAQKEAKRQQQIETTRAAQLKAILAEKDRVSKKAKTDMANAAVTRIKAEKEIKQQDAEIAKLKIQIDLLRNQVASAEEKAKTAEQTAEAGRQEVEKTKKELSDLSVRKRKADSANVMSGARITRLKAEYRRLLTQRDQAVAGTKKAEQDSYSNQASQNKLSRDISSVKSNP